MYKSKIDATLPCRLNNNIRTPGHQVIRVIEQRAMHRPTMHFYPYNPTGDVVDIILLCSMARVWCITYMSEI